MADYSFLARSTRVLANSSYVIAHTFFKVARFGID